ncbi:YheC/YheD family protein [Neobacillus sp. LXY-1]|uniref:YheC/YheD family endospore coat-associated protein n=1 Tax=Neobacillus sp. LXY-1 TaxID=3379133 RepID=UPI003EE25756
MIALGIMSLHLDSEASYITEMARHAEQCGIECYRFIPYEINPHSLKVNGRKFNNQTGIWEDTEFPIPAILYDRCYYGDDEHSKKCLPVVSWLKSRNDITFLGYGLPNKHELYETLKTSVLSAYLPSTELVAQPEMVLASLKKMKKVIIKPVNGSQGYGIYYIKINEKSYHVKTEKNKKIISRIFPNERKLLHWLKTLIAQHKYLLQPYLELSNSALQPFDVRVLLQKNENGIWGEMGRGVRIGNSGGVLSNLSAGGTVIPYMDWASSLSGKTEFIHQEIDYILNELPHLLEHQFLPLFELGIDIGIAKNGSIWILDMNSKPGRKVILQTRPEISTQLYRAPLLYARHLAQTGHTERKTFYEKTLSH